MKLFDILKQQGLFSNDIKTRIKNNQITINGEVIKTDIELDIIFDIINNNNIIKFNSENKIVEEKLIEEHPIVLESGRFISDTIRLNPIFAQQMKIFGFENLFDSNIKNDLTSILERHILIKISKKDSFILKKK